MARIQGMDRDALLDRARGRGVNPLVYWGLRAILQPFFHLYWRVSRIGREHIPATGPLIIAANHRSFLDPFVIAVMARRPIYFMTKKEAFINRPAAWLLASLGAYPIDREGGDQEAMDATKAILARGDGVLIFPEGTRTRPGPLGRPKRGVGRLALETGAAVVPLAGARPAGGRRRWGGPAPRTSGAAGGSGPGGCGSRSGARAPSRASRTPPRSLPRRRPHGSGPT